MSVQQLRSIKRRLIVQIAKYDLWAREATRAIRYFRHFFFSFTECLYTYLFLKQRLDIFQDRKAKQIKSKNSAFSHQEIDYLFTAVCRNVPQSAFFSCFTSCPSIFRRSYLVQSSTLLLQFFSLVLQLLMNLNNLIGRKKKIKHVRNVQPRKIEENFYGFVKIMSDFQVCLSRSSIFLNPLI